VSSESGATPAGTAPFADPDRTTRARVRDAAIARFSAEGIAAATLKTIAADAGVTAQLVIHHFGSKHGLAAACDQHVVATIREHKHAAMSAGAGLDPVQALRDAEREGPLLEYLARRLVEDSPEVEQLIDEAVDDAVDYMEAGVRSGLLKPTDRPRERAVVLVLWSLGGLVLHRHAQRLLGVDLTGSTEQQLGWILPATEILTDGVLQSGTLDLLRRATGPTQADDGKGAP
jgi:AcrR family transcriptional regulator